MRTLKRSRSSEDPQYPRDVKHIKRANNGADSVNANVPGGGFGRLTEELIVNIFSHLDLYGLLTCRLVCSQWKRVASENSIWRNLLETQFRGERTFHLHHDDDDNKHSLWQSLFRLHYNWKRGACAIRDFSLPDSLCKDSCNCRGPEREREQLHFAVYGKYLFTITGSLDLWVSATDSEITSGAKLKSEAINIAGAGADHYVTALSASASPSVSDDPESKNSKNHGSRNIQAKYIRLCIGFADGKFVVCDIDTACMKSADALKIVQTLDFQPTTEFQRPVQKIASFRNIIASISKPCTLNVYLTRGDKILHIHDLMSLLKYQFTLTVSQSCLNEHWITVTAVFCRPSITGWDIGMQELHMDVYGNVRKSRTAYCPCDGHRAPSTLAYAYPYILSGNDENLLVSYKVEASNELAIHKLDTLWGHCSGIGHVDISSSKRAVSISKRGTEIRWWDLESSSSPSLGGITKDNGSREEWALGHTLSKILGFSDEVLLLHTISTGTPAITVYDFR